MKVIAFYNIKGGVGKTTAAVNIAYAAARDGFRTLLCDLDAQGSASNYFKITAKGPKAKKLVSGGRKIGERIRESGYEGLYILPSHISYRNLAVELSNRKKSGTRMKSSLEQAGGDYDILIVDSPATLDLEAENIFRTADLIVVPLIPTTLSVNSYALVRNFFEKKGLDGSRIRIFFALADLRRKMHRTTIEDFKNSAEAFRTVIPYSSAVEKTGLIREPLLARSRSSRAASAYEGIWTEIREAGDLNPPPRPPNR